MIQMEISDAHREGRLRYRPLRERLAFSNKREEEGLFEGRRAGSG